MEFDPRELALIFSSTEWSTEEPFTSMEPITSQGGASDSDDSGFQWDEWNVYLGAGLIGLLLIVLVVYCVMRSKKLKKQTKAVKRDDYRRLSQENKENYGTRGNDQDDMVHHTNV